MNGADGGWKEHVVGWDPGSGAASYTCCCCAQAGGWHGSSTFVFIGRGDGVVLVGVLGEGKWVECGQGDGSVAMVRAERLGAKEVLCVAAMEGGQVCLARVREGEGGERSISWEMAPLHLPSTASDIAFLRSSTETTLLVGSGKAVHVVQYLDMALEVVRNGGDEVWWECEQDESVVQIHSDSGCVFISTTKRSLVAYRSTEGKLPSCPTQIGSKTRNGKFGACIDPAASTFFPDDDNAVDKTHCWGFCSRPKGRLWVTCDGTVKATLRLPPEVASLGPSSRLLPLGRWLMMISDKGIAVLNIDDTERVVTRAFDNNCTPNRVACAGESCLIMGMGGEIVQWEPDGNDRDPSTEREVSNEITQKELHPTAMIGNGGPSSADRSTQDIGGGKNQGKSIDEGSGVDVYEPGPEEDDDALPVSLFNTGGEWQTAQVKIEGKLKPKKSAIKRKTSKVVEVEADFFSRTESNGKASARNMAVIPDKSLQHKSASHSLVGIFEHWSYYITDENERMIQEYLSARSSSIPGNGDSQSDYTAYRNVAMEKLEEARNLGDASGLLFHLLQWVDNVSDCDRTLCVTEDVQTSMQELLASCFEMQFDLRSVVEKNRGWDDEDALQFLRENWNQMNLTHVQKISVMNAWADTQIAAETLLLEPSRHERILSVESVDSGRRSRTPSKAKGSTPLRGDKDISKRRAELMERATSMESLDDVALEAKRDLGAREALLVIRDAVSKRGLEPRSLITALNSVLKDDDADAVDSRLRTNMHSMGPPNIVRARLPDGLVSIVEECVDCDTASTPPPPSEEIPESWGVLVSFKGSTCARCGLPLRLSGVQTKVVVLSNGLCFHLGCKPVQEDAMLKW